MKMVLQFGFLCTLLSFMQLCKAKEQAQLSSDLLTCDTDYWLNVSCFLDSRAIPNRTENITYQLKFSLHNNNIVNFCSLSVEKDGYSCTFTAKLEFYHDSFTNYHKFTISLCQLNQSVPLKRNYKPARHIKPITPYNVMVEYENGSYIFTWISGYEDHEYRLALPFQYILRYHKAQEYSMKDLHTSTTTYRIPEMYLDPGTEYVAKVYNRIIPTATYNGTISHGSAEIRWKTPSVTVTNVVDIVIPVCLAVGLMSLLLLPVARMKIKKCVETPVPHVPSLNKTAQHWLFKGHMQQMYSEEISRIDMITKITARQQLQECTSMIYPHCPTPYVGPLMEVWAPCLTPDTRLTANTPCNDLSFLPDDCGIEESLLCLSRAEGVEGLVSLDDLEPSLEICKPSEALMITPNPVCFVQNYCTLTNTAVGLIPTFCGVQCVPSLDLGLNGHTTPDLLNMHIEENTPELDTVTLDNMQLSMEE